MPMSKTLGIKGRPSALFDKTMACYGKLSHFYSKTFFEASILEQ